jgi:hypothetical protein
MMRPEIEALEEEARTTGEAFLTVRASKGLRLGVTARWEDGIITLNLEVQIRLLPSRSGVDVKALRARVEDLAGLEAAGFHLFHFEDGWVLATRSVSHPELDDTIAKIMGLFNEEDRYHGRA